MKPKTRMQELSDYFGKILHEIYPDTIRPDEENPKSTSKKAPDHYIPSRKIAIERKAITVDLSSGRSVGQKMQAAKKADFVVFGTTWVNFDGREGLAFADKMTGELRSRIREAEKQLETFCADQNDILTVCCIFTEISNTNHYEWERKYLPTRELVRTSAFAEFERKKIDALALFTLDHTARFCLDIAQTVYAEGHLEREFAEFVSVVGSVASRLPIEPDLSVLSEFHFEPVKPH